MCPKEANTYPPPTMLTKSTFTYYLTSSSPSVKPLTHLPRHNIRAPFRLDYHPGFAPQPPSLAADFPDHAHQYMHFCITTLNTYTVQAPTYPTSKQIASRCCNTILLRIQYQTIALRSQNVQGSARQCSTTVQKGATVEGLTM